MAFVEKRLWDIWVEGSDRATPASFVGTAEGNTFSAACHAWYRKNPEQAKFFSLDRLTYWGCRLYDNEADARKAFG